MKVNKIFLIIISILSIILSLCTLDTINDYANHIQIKGDIIDCYITLIYSLFIELFCIYFLYKLKDK